MGDFVLQRVAVTPVEPAIQPRLTFVVAVDGHRIRFETTAKGYARLTGRRHARVKAMHAAYARRSR